MLTILRRVYIVLCMHEEDELEEIISNYRQIIWESIEIM